MTDLEPEACRVDVWLWRARLFKTRSQAAAFVDGGAVRLARQGRQARLDKASRLVRPGDDLVFVRDGRVMELTVLNPGVRRGTSAEARSLYRAVETPSPG